MGPGVGVGVGVGVAAAGGNLGHVLGGGGGGGGVLARRGSASNQHASSPSSSSLAGSPPPPIGLSGGRGSAGSETGVGGGAPGGESGGGRWTGTQDPAVRRWLCLCIAKLCWRFTDAQDACLRHVESLFACLQGKGERHGTETERFKRFYCGGMEI